MKHFILFLFVAVTFKIASQNQEFKKIDSILTSKVKSNHPGIAVGILKDGKIIYEKYLGLANLQHQVKFDENTRSNIASTAKQFTALMILQLSLDNKLSLEDDIRKYLSKLYPNVKKEIKIRHLLNHTSGIRDYVELLDMDGEVWWKRFGYDNDDVLALMESQEELGFKPGSTYSYSNTNYNLLTKVIEKVTGKTFNEYSKSFFENLGMKETSFVERYMKVIPNRANPYSDWGRGEWWEVPTVTKTNGEGFLFTTLKDQLIFEKAIQNANHNNNVLLIKSQQPIPNSEIQTYGFGLELEDKLGRKAVHHSGGTYGFHSQMYRFPEEKLTIFAMSNNGNISTNLIAQSIAKLLLPKSTQKPKYDSKFYELTDSKAEVTIFGKYIYPNKNSVVEILKKEGKLFWKEKNFTVEMVSEDNNIYKFTNNPKLKVRFYEDKMVEYYPSGKTMQYASISEKPLSKSDLYSLVGNYYNSELNISFDIKLNKKNKLQLKLSTDNEFNDVIIYNDRFLLADSYFLTLKRDQFNRVTEILFTYGRALNIKFSKKTNLKFQPKISTENGSIQVTTVGSNNGTSDILLTKNDTKGNEIWFKRLGGKSYDKASSILAIKDGYLIVGSTSSYGKGNYDFYVIKTDKKGKQIWQKTYGDFYNEYGYSAQKTKEGFIIKGTKQNCPNNTDINRKCTTNVWFVTIDENGKELSNKVLEEINN